MFALQRVAPNETLKRLENVARGAGLDQVAWARMAGLTRVKLNMAINGKANLSESEYAALVDALRDTVTERMEAFSRFITVDLAQDSMAAV